MTTTMRWLPEAAGDRFYDAVSSLNRQSQAKYGCDLLLAGYRGGAGSLRTLDEIWDAFADAGAEAARLPEGHPKEYLQGMLAGLRMLVRVMQGDEIPYAQQILDMQQVVSRPVTQEQIDGLSQLLDRELYALGYRRGGTPEKAMAFLEEHTLSPESVVPAAKAFLGRSRQACAARVLPLPEGDGIDDIRGVRQVIYNGNSAYLGRYKGRLSFNIDRPWSLPTFANVLCHEGYPGHHAFYCRWDVLFQRGQLPLEAAYYVKNTPTNCLFEGTPENALHFLGWDDPDDPADEVTDLEKRQFSAGRKLLDLQRMYQQNGCHYVNLEGMGERDATAYLMSSGLFQPSEAAGSYRFFTDATRRTYYPSYFYGRWLVWNAYRRFPRARRGAFFRLLYDQPHTNATFIRAVTQALGTESGSPLRRKGADSPCGGMQKRASGRPSSALWAASAP